MEIPITQLPPGDPRLVDAIVGQLKSKGIFDKLRKECLADVDTKPAFLNLRLRVDGQVKKFLETKTWKADLNKNHLRDGVRKNIQESSILDSGIDAIINQIVNPKIKPLILPYVEDTVYGYLQIEKPKREIIDQAVAPVPVYNEPPPSYPPQNHACLYAEAPMGFPYPAPVEKKEAPSQFPFPADKMDSVSSSESEISVGGGESPAEVKPKELIHEVIPMETDVISSEEDDILARPSPPKSSSLGSAEQSNDVKMEEDNAVDSFDTARITVGTEAVTDAVGSLNLKEKDEVSCEPKEKTLVAPLFDNRSLDSISSNSSGLSFSPLSTKRSSPEKVKSIDTDNSRQSTPLVDEKSLSPQQSSDSSKPWEGNKESSLDERITIANFGGPFGQPEKAPLIGTSPVSTENSQDTVEKSGSSSESKPKSEGELSGSSSACTPEPAKERSEPSKEKERSHKHSHHSRSRSKEREKSRHKSSHRSKDHKHSKSRHDDHSSHRDKKHHRRDRDDDKDRDKNSSRSHHSSSHGSSSTQKSSSSGDTKDRKEKSSSDHRHKSKHSSSSSRRDSTSHRKRSRTPDKKDRSEEDKKSKEDLKSRESNLGSRKGKDKKVVAVIKEDKTFMIQLNKSKSKKVESPKIVASPKTKFESMKESKSNNNNNLSPETKTETPVRKIKSSRAQEFDSSKKDSAKKNPKKIIPKRMIASSSSSEDSSSDSDSSSSESEAEPLFVSPKSKRLQKQIGVRSTTIVTTSVSTTDDDSSDKITLKQVKIPLFSPMKEQKKPKAQSEKKKERFKNTGVINKNVTNIVKKKFKSKTPEKPEFNICFGSSDSEDSDFSGFLSSVIPKSKTPKKPVKKINKFSPAKQRQLPMQRKVVASELLESTGSDYSTDMDLPIIQFLQSEKPNDFLGFDDDSLANTKLRSYLSTCYRLEDTDDEDSDSSFVTSFLPKKEKPLVIANFSSFIETSSTQNLANSFYKFDGVAMTPQSICSNSTEADITKGSQTASDDSGLVSDSTSTTKRKIAPSESCPFSKKRRILEAVRSEMEETLAKDKIVLNSYSLLTPEEDRTSSKEYEVDLQRGTSYSPLSPASESSADETKLKESSALVSATRQEVKPGMNET